MSTRFMIQTSSGSKLASREAFMMLHPGREPDCELKEGDVIELAEGFFILNSDLNPMEMASEEQINRARERNGG